MLPTHTHTHTDTHTHTHTHTSSVIKAAWGETRKLEQEEDGRRPTADGLRQRGRVVIGRRRSERKQKTLRFIDLIWFNYIPKSFFYDRHISSFRCFHFHWYFSFYTFTNTNFFQDLRFNLPSFQGFHFDSLVLELLLTPPLLSAPPLSAHTWNDTSSSKLHINWHLLTLEGRLWFLWAL